MIRIGLVGCGAIGSQLAQIIQKRFKTRTRLIGLHDFRADAARALAARLRPAVPVLSLCQLVRRSDLVLEAASGAAVRQILPEALRWRRDLMVMSAGGLLDHSALIRKMKKAGLRLYVPSGAVLGLDGLKAAAIGRLSRVTLTTRKPPISLGMKPSQKPVVVFQGNAAAAVKKFPQNINVAATLSLAGLGPARTRVRIIADPAVRRNVHEVEVIGDFGTFRVRTENRPSPKNPKTSQLAIQSAVATLERIVGSFQVGT